LYRRGRAPKIKEMIVHKKYDEILFNEYLCLHLRFFYPHLPFNNFFIYIKQYFFLLFCFFQTLFFIFISPLFYFYYFFCMARKFHTAMNIYINVHDSQYKYFCNHTLCFHAFYSVSIVHIYNDCLNIPI